MGGICERPGCQRPAAAAVAADPRRLIVWVGDLATSAETVNALCAPHADNLAVPLGWERRDLRDVPYLMAVPSPETVPGPDPVKPRRRSGRKGSPSMAPVPISSGTTTPEGGGGSAPSRPQTTSTASGAAQRTPARPGPGIPVIAKAHLDELHRVRTELSADTVALLDAGGDTPLLARAFRTVRAAG
ncbi:MAG: DUF3499 family protein [Acidimicrobiales bacterium]